jgi:hypothetical protein
MNNKLIFQEIEDGEANIDIICYKGKQNDNVEFEDYVVGETTTEYDGNKIYYAKIVLYGSSSKSTILHEIIHALGYKGHSVYGDSIMSSYADNQNLDNNTTAFLLDLYN